MIYYVGLGEIVWIISLKGTDPEEIYGKKWSFAGRKSKTDRCLCRGSGLFFDRGQSGSKLVRPWELRKHPGTDAGSLAFWSAMEEERLAFARYVGTALPEERERFEQSRMETRRRLEELPFDYRETGSERYARTWSIRNMYENYETELEVLEETDREDPEYVNRLYRIYRVQNYLKDKAGQLEQMTMEDGSERYEKHRFLFQSFRLPVSCGGSLRCGWLSG